MMRRFLLGLIVAAAASGAMTASAQGRAVRQGPVECAMAADATADTVVIGTGFVVDTPSGNSILRCQAVIPQGIPRPQHAVQLRRLLCFTGTQLTTKSLNVITPSGRVMLKCWFNGRIRAAASTAARAGTRPIGR